MNPDVQDSKTRGCLAGLVADSSRKGPGLISHAPETRRCSSRKSLSRRNATCQQEQCGVGAIYLRDHLFLRSLVFLMSSTWDLSLAHLPAVLVIFLVIRKLSASIWSSVSEVPGPVSTSVSLLFVKSLHHWQHIRKVLIGSGVMR